MIRLARGESNGVRPAHPEGNVQECIGLGEGDLSTKHQDLRLGYFNI